VLDSTIGICAGADPLVIDEIDELMPSEVLREENSDIITSGDVLQWFLYATHVSLRNRFIYIETPKAACSTMKRMLQRLEVDDPEWRRSSYLHDRKCSPLLTPLQVPSFRRLRQDSCIKKFCVIRSPYTRVLSAYFDKICTHQPQRHIVAEILGRTKSQQGDEITFYDFVTAVATQRPEEMDPHWRPQKLLLYVPEFHYDLMLRVETLDADIELLGHLLGCDLRPFYSRIQRGRTDSPLKLPEYYRDDGVFRLVSRIYQDDIELVRSHLPKGEDLDPRDSR